LVIDDLLVESVDFVIVIYIFSHAFIDLYVGIPKFLQPGQSEAVYLSKGLVDGTYLNVLWRRTLCGFCLSAFFILLQTQAMIAESNSLVHRAGAINGPSVLEDGHREVLAGQPLGLSQEGAGVHALVWVDNDELADNLPGLLGERIGWVLEDASLYPHVELIFTLASEWKLPSEHYVEEDAQCP
jgi:hypothetical protein